MNAWERVLLQVGLSLAILVINAITLFIMVVAIIRCGGRGSDLLPVRRGPQASTAIMP